LFFQVTKPYVTFILSLLISDAFASLLLGIQLLFGSYLPVVHGIEVSGCLIFVAEALKLAGIIVTVFHLLVMVMIHLAGVTYPVRFKEVKSVQSRTNLGMFEFRGIYSQFIYSNHDVYVHI
jgi:predicted exporter